MRQNDKREWLQVQISPDLKHALRVKAVQDKENMTTAVEAVLKLYVSGELDDQLKALEPKEEAIA